MRCPFGWCIIRRHLGRGELGTLPDISIKSVEIAPRDEIGGKKKTKKRMGKLTSITVLSRELPQQH